MSEPILVKAFAHSCCHDQADFLNKASRELFGTCKGRHGFEGQLWEIVKNLNEDGESLIKALSHFIELKTKKIE